MKPNSLTAALSQPRMAVHDYSHTIFKLKPKIRVIHIVEPEIIKTTVEDFQSLVQRLTGKPAERRRRRTEEGSRGSSLTLQPKPHSSIRVSKTEPADAPALQERPKMKIEVEEMHDAEVDGFFHDMNEFPLLSFMPSLFSVFEEMPLC